MSKVKLLIIAMLIYISRVKFNQDIACSYQIGFCNCNIIIFLYLSSYLFNLNLLLLVICLSVQYSINTLIFLYVDRFDTDIGHSMSAISVIL